ncbi:unnamed protein product [Aureobasidium vineae]|uniref:Uncharacterized protein n=1 Tax=Aureobasidium vineae TaxID=2773715 RepID=A0A9N8JU87_9PEZI|nr:unnamed protein product [Aureobasidium vineae]
MDVLKIFLPCCLGASHDELINDIADPVAEKFTTYTDMPSVVEVQSAVESTSNKLLHFITTTDTFNTPAYNVQIQDIIKANQPITVQSSWWIQAVLKTLHKAMTELVKKVENHSQELSPAMHKLFIEAETLAQEFTRFTTNYPDSTFFIETVALALLIEVLAPVLLEALGFGIEGVIGGSLAASFQSLYPDVPYGSLFSKLQSFAARYGKSLVKH